MTLQRGILSILVLATLVTGSACAPEPSAALRPAPAAYSAGTYKAIDNAAGIYVETTVGQWPGDDAVLRHTTPIHVLLRNEGDSAVAIEYRYFELTDRSGRRYAALPPLDIERRAGEAPAVQLSNLLLDPLFVARGYQVHPMYGPLYDQLPELQTNRYRLGYSLDYHETNWSYWRDHQVLPTREMRSHAIPQGVLEPGGEIEGYFYFEKVDEEVGLVAFRANFVDAETGKTIARTSIPFETYPQSNLE